MVPCVDLTQGLGFDPLVYRKRQGATLSIRVNHSTRRRDAFGGIAVGEKFSYHVSIGSWVVCRFASLVNMIYQ